MNNAHQNEIERLLKLLGLVKENMFFKNFLEANQSFKGL